MSGGRCSGGSSASDNDGEKECWSWWYDSGARDNDYKDGVLVAVAVVVALVVIVVIMVLKMMMVMAVVVVVKMVMAYFVWV